MQNTDRETRQMIRCGWELPPRAELASCVSVIGVLGYEPEPRIVDGIEWPGQIAICPGYTTQLPVVIEIARARFHAEKTSLETFCRGPAPDSILRGIEILEGAYNECRDWCTKNPVKS